MSGPALSGPQPSDALLAEALLGERIDDALVARVGARLEAVRERIANAGGEVGAIRIVAVTKGFGLAAIRVARALGLDAIGENYADELVAKAERLARLGEARGCSWHFLGAIQQNKVARLAPYVARYEGVDRLVEGRRIAREAPGARVLVEVDFSQAPGRGGVAPEAAAGLVGQLRELELCVEGLMTVAPLGEAAEAARAFGGLSELADGLELAERSMGMSDDFELAVRAGATTLRLGTVLFGPRLPPPKVPK